MVDMAQEGDGGDTLDELLEAELGELEVELNPQGTLAERIRAAYPGSSFDVRAEAVYLDVLEDVDVRAVDRAVEDLLREGHPDPPAAGVIRSRALGGEPAPAAPVPV